MEVPRWGPGTKPQQGAWGRSPAEAGAFTVKPVFFACPLFREFRDPDEFAKITGHKYIYIYILAAVY